MIGDRLNTDILFGKQGLISTLLVLTGTFLVFASQSRCLLCQLLGITKEEEVFGANASPIIPDYVASSIGDFRALEKK